MGGLFSRCVPDGEPVEPHANFGFPIFADHHFHLGYWVYAAGYYAKYHQEWAEGKACIVSACYDKVKAFTTLLFSEFALEYVMNMWYVMNMFSSWPPSRPIAYVSCNYDTAGSDIRDHRIPE